MKTLIFSTFLHSTYTCIVFFYVDWIRVSAFKKKGDHQNKSHILLLVRGEVRGSRFEPNFSDLHEIVGKSTKIQYHQKRKKSFPSPFSPYFAKKCCFNEVSLVSDVPIRSLILCNCGIREHVQTAIAASSIAVTTGILLPRSEQPVQMRQLCVGGSTDLG